MSIAFVARIIGMIVLGIGGVYFGVGLGRLAEGSLELWASVMGLVGALVGLVLTPILVVKPISIMRARLAQASARTLFAGVIGLIISLIIAGLLAFPLSLLPEPFSQILPIALAVIFSYLGVAVFITRQNDIFSVISNLPRRGGEDSTDPQYERTILMDTSVIIDGRIADIARTGFLAGTLMIPRFVLTELQYIADSGDSLRRQRGRRGLEVLSQLQKDPAIPVNVSDIDVEGSTAVDDKLVILARQLKAPILTNDFNLNRVAELQGVNILNINELANAVKAVYLPGEELAIRVIQDGREPGQGVGYLEDGTMVVVQDGNKFIGAEINTVVTKVLQTAAGRMIFSRPEDAL